jgi:hypothetical protein
VCGAPPDGLIAFPPRTDSFDFRRQLESRYQQFGRGASQSSVDAEGGVVWTQEYLRYRVNQCDHATAVQKVFSQIDGGGVAPTCFVPCVFTIAPAAHTVPAAGGTFTAVVTKASGNCTFFAESLDPWVSLGSGTSGNAETTTLTYTVAPNSGAARYTLVRIRWTNNSTLLEINQTGNDIAFTMTDPNNAPTATTTCLIKAVAGTPCVFTATGTVAGPATYSWSVSYIYGGTVTHNQAGASPNFQFTQTCGGPGSTAGGTETALNVTLTVTDANGAMWTFQSGSGDQPPLIIKLFTC